jgi:hypothetical protein
MANPHKGEVAFEADGKRYTLSFSANAICEAEEHFGSDPGEVLSEAIGDKPCKGRLQILRRFFWLALGDHHADVTFEDTKALLKRIAPADMAVMVGKAFAFAMPDVDAGAPVDPPTPGGPAVGIGPASSTDGSIPAEPKPNSGA